MKNWREELQFVVNLVVSLGFGVLAFAMGAGLIYYILFRVLWGI